MLDQRILNGKPRATLLESIYGEVMVISPRQDGLKMSQHPSVEEASEWIGAQGWAVGICHLHGPYGKENKEMQKGHDGN